MDIKFINGGITAPSGFTANGICCSIKPSNTTKSDLAFIYSDVICQASGIYTQNLVKGAPILVTKENLKDGTAQAIIVNSGNANTCNIDGMEKAYKMCKIASDVLNVHEKDVIVASTGVIGQILPIEKIEAKAEQLSKTLTKDGGHEAAIAIMTTDTVEKEIAVTFTIDGKEVVIGGMAKGSGMIHINMATMLSFITTDVNISSEMLSCALNETADETFNMISVDGDSSTNDTLTIMANGKAQNKIIETKDENYNIFVEGLKIVLEELSKKIAGDGEGATKLIIADVKNAKTKIDAKKVAKTVICSSLVKTAMCGEDANWGRVLCAIGYSGADVDVQKIDVSFISNKGRIDVCKNGYGIPFSEEKAKEILKEKQITIFIDLIEGNENARAYGCDLTHEYVSINADYRT